MSARPGDPPVRTYRRIAEELMRRIQAGEYAPNQRMPAERDLAQLLSVSRTTLREALIALELADVIEIRGGSGIFVRAARTPSFSLPDSGMLEDPGPFEVLEARRAVEGEAAFNAAMKAHRSQIRSLEAVLGRIDGAADSELEEYARHDRAFHVQIAEMSANTILVRMVNYLWDLRDGPLWQSWFVGSRSPEYRKRSVVDHQELFDFISHGQADLARAAMVSHIDRIVHRFNHYLDQAETRPDDPGPDLD
jgi:DNA-binding FadR family transcriptional regulator